MLRKLIIALLVNIVFFAESYASANKIAVVDVQMILEQSKAVSAIRNAAEKINQELQNELQNKENELKILEKKLIESKEQLPQAEFEKEVMKFNKQVTGAQKNIQDRKLRLEQAHAKAISKVNEVALKIISSLASEGKYSVVLPSTQVLYANDKLNITPEVLVRLNTTIPYVELKY